MFIQRDYNRTENDDFKLNVEKYLRPEDRKEAMPIYNPENKEKLEIVGWKIQNQYE